MLFPSDAARCHQWAISVDTVFFEKQVKKDKEKQPVKNRVQSTD
jgi:hypothetical protein